MNMAAIRQLNRFWEIYFQRKNTKQIMKTIDYIPTSKIERATKLVQTGAKVGVNYLKYYGEKMVNSDLTRDKLNEDNAEDIYDGLKSLKGSALESCSNVKYGQKFFATGVCREIFIVSIFCSATFGSIGIENIQEKFWKNTL